MEIVKSYSDKYILQDINGNVLCSFYDLETTVLVKRFIEGDSLTEEQENIAIGAIECHDEEMKRNEEERQQKKQSEKERARMRKEAKASQEVGKRLKELRKETPLQEVANAVHITENSLIAYEAGKRIPRDEVKIALADYYGINVATLFNVGLKSEKEGDTCNG